MNKILWRPEEARNSNSASSVKCPQRRYKGGGDRENGIFRKPCFVCFTLRLEHNNWADVTLLDTRRIPEVVPAHYKEPA